MSNIYFALIIMCFSYGNLIEINVCPKSAKAGSPEQGAAGVWKGRHKGSPSGVFRFLTPGSRR